MPSHRAQRDDAVVGAPVAHHADGPHRQENRESLPDPVVEAGRADPVEMDRVGLFSRVARAGERAAADEARRQAELAPPRCISA
jgi:hypothetical protein